MSWSHDGQSKRPLRQDKHGHIFCSVYYPFITTLSCCWTHYYILHRNFHITSPNDDDTTNCRKDLETLINESSDNTITCYTDGSWTKSGVGAGFLTTTNNSPHNIINYSSFKLPDFCSVFQAEVTAILQRNSNQVIRSYSFGQTVSLLFKHSRTNYQEVRPLYNVTRY